MERLRSCLMPANDYQQGQVCGSNVIADLLQGKLQALAHASRLNSLSM